MKKLFLLLVLMITVQLNAQTTFEKYYGVANTTDFCNSMIAVDDGFALFGTSNQEDVGQQAYLLRIDATGTELWSQYYGEADDEYGIEVLPSPDGHFYVVGHIGTFEEGGNIFAKKVSGDDGSVLWENTYVSEKNQATQKAILAIDGSSILIAGTEEGDLNETQAFTMQLDENGAKTWEQAYTSFSVADGTYSIKATPSNFYILTGYTATPQYNSALPKIWKLDQEGTLLADRTIDIVDENDIPYFVTIMDIHIEDNGNMYLAGGGPSYNSYSNGPPFIAYTDSAGSLMWINIDAENSFSSQSRFFNHITPISDNEIIAVGTSTNDNNNDIILRTVTNTGQSFNNFKDFNNGIDEANAVVKTDNGYAIAGHSSGLNENGYDFFFAPVDNNLDVSSTQSYGTIGSQHGSGTTSFTTTNDGGYLISSLTNIGANQRSTPSLFKLDADGNDATEFVIDNNELIRSYQIIQSNDDNYVLQGLSSGATNITKVTEEGAILWDTRLDSSRANFQKAVIATDGGYHAGGRGTLGDLYWCKLNESGDLMWQKHHRPEYATAANAYGILENSAGELIVSGRADNVLNTTNGVTATRPYLLKSNSNGDIIWESAYIAEGATTFGRILKTIQTSDGNYITIGTISDADGVFNMHIMKVSNSNGAIMWDKIYLQAGDAFGSYDVTETSEGDLVFLANLTPESGETADRQGALIKTDANGNEMWTKFYSTAGDGPILYHLEPMENSYVLGGVVTLNNAFVSVLIKTDADGNVVSTNIEDLDIQTTEISITPNPNKGEFVLDFENEMKGDIEVIVFDVSGKEHHRQSTKKTDKHYQQNFNLSLEAGVYFCQISDGNTVFTKKVIIR